MSVLGLAHNERIVATISADKADCAIHKYHSPRPAELHIHHVHPLGWGGPDVAENRIYLCPTGHANVHHLLWAYTRNGGRPAWKVLRQYSVPERELAERAWASRS